MGVELNAPPDAFIMVDGGIVRHSEIRFIDLRQIDQQVAIVHTMWNGAHKVTGFAAMELVWMLKPGAVEGHRLKWKKNAWALHNLLAHPVMQLLAFCGFYKKAMYVHDSTVPKPIPDARE